MRWGPKEIKDPGTCPPHVCGGNHEYPGKHLTREPTGAGLQEGMLWVPLGSSHHWPEESGAAQRGRFVTSCLK